MERLAVLALIASAALAADPVIKQASNTDPEGKVGERPYEMAWVDRKPAHPELVDFEDLKGWTAAGLGGCTAELVRSREERMFGSFTAKAVYTGKTAASAFELRPPEAVPIPGKPQAVQLWVRGNNWGWHPKPRTARTHVTLIVRDAKDETFDVHVGTVNFDDWFLMHATFVSPTGQLARIAARGGDGALDYPLRFVAIRVTGCSDEDEARLFFDSLQFYAPAYEPLPHLALPPLEGVPWPTTPDTITPTPKEEMKTSVRHDGDSYVLEAKGQRDEITWIYRPGKGTLDDLTVEINGRRFQPCAGGGPLVYSGFRRRDIGPEDVYYCGMELRSHRIDGDTAEIRWWAGDPGSGGQELTYRLRAVGKSLQISIAAVPDTCLLGYKKAKGGLFTGLTIGHTAGTPGAESFAVPYLSFDHTSPRVVHWDGVFLSALLDWYNSDASVFEAEHGKPKPDQVIYNAGSRYLPKTYPIPSPPFRAGDNPFAARNPLRERLIVTVATDVHEVLPHIPHPRNPQAHKAIGAIWRNVGAPNRDLLRRLKAHGVERFICPLHEVGWRDAGESFTFRLAAAPRIGDEAMREYGEWVRGLGYWFGLYANYTDFAPVNGYWDPDRVCLQSDGNWTGAWPRCYAPKPTFAWMAEAELAPRIARKFGANTCYSDVHTALVPWRRTDYDARVPGAGMLRATWQSYARLLWNECESYGGPVFSEGRAHWFYAGLVTGNYAQVTGAERWKQPPLVDFDLLKMHPLMTDFGMGMPSMFYPRHGSEWRQPRDRTSPWLDRFLTSTLAFGHIGFLALDWGFEGALKSYYLTNAVQRRYALVPVEAIRYFDGETLLTTSDAIRTGAYRRGQVYVRYDNGLELWCNLSFEHDWRVECDGQSYLLPPTGHLARLPGELLQYSALVDGRRIDYVNSPQYLYVDTRDRLAAVGPVVCKGAVALKRALAVDTWRVIPVAGCDELSLRPTRLGLAPTDRIGAEALDLDGNALGEATVRVSNLGQTIFPVNDAVRYRVRPTGITVAPPPDGDVRRVVGGLEYAVGTAVRNQGRDTLRQTTLVAELIGPTGKATRVGETPGPQQVGRREDGFVRVPIRVPASAKPGERLWFRVRAAGSIHAMPAEGSAWFTAVAAPAIDVDLQPADAAPQRPGSRQELTLTLRSHLPGRTSVSLQAQAPPLSPQPATMILELEEGKEQKVALSYALPAEPAVAPIDLTFRFPQGEMTRRRWLRVVEAESVAVDLTKRPPSHLGMAYRGEDEQALRADSGASFYAAKRQVGGVAKDGFFCHPPYKGGVGYAVGAFEVVLPDEPCAFEASVGFADGSSTGDGCVFSVQVRAGDKVETVGKLQYGELERWKRLRADLSEFAGRKVTLRLVTDVGPKDNSSSDWAVWGEPRIVLTGRRLLPEVFTEKPTLPVSPPLKPVRGLKASDLGTVAAAKVVLDTCGADGGDYQSDLYLNEVLVGHTPPSRGDREWTTDQAVAVPAEALKTVGPRNTVAIRNPGLDYFKVRRLRLWFRLADGREGTSVVVNGPLCTPPGWEFAEGTLIPHGQPIVAACDIPAAERE